MLLQRVGQWRTFSTLIYGTSRHFLNLKKSPIHTMAKTLNIFDFDGTLFRSPVPSPKLWMNTLLGKIKGAPSTGGLGWYQELITLQPPYVHEHPDTSWFNPSILEKCRSSISDPNAITVLLTGRLVVYEDRIKHILSKENLVFDHYGLKPEVDIFTMKFKENFIKRLLDNEKDVTKVVIYEDREEHAIKFENFFKQMKMEYEVILVPQNVTYLSRDQELELVKILLAKNTPQLQIVELPSYTGVILDEDSRKALLQCFPPPTDWLVTAHHCTISKGTQPLPGDLKVGDKVEIEVTAVGYDTRNLAVKVTGIESSNEVPHVTIAHSPFSKPSDSNLIRDWIPIEDVVKNGGKITQHAAQSEDGSTSTAPLNSIEAKLTGEGLKLRGTIEVQTMFEKFDPPVQVVKQDTGPKSSFVPKGTNLLEMIKKYHPTIQDKKDVSAMVKLIREWCQPETSIEALEEYVKSSTIDTSTNTNK